MTQLSLVSSVPPPTVPAGGFEVVIADPPWAFASNSKEKPGRNARRHYPCMSDTELVFMPVADWCARDALMLMWTTAPMLVRSLAVLSAWGFSYVSQLVWVKSRTATGYWVRNRHEIVLVGKRGSGPGRPGSRAPFPVSVIEAPSREHSRKPEYLHDVCDATWPDAARLEIFARTPRPGWVAWGNDTGRFAA